MGSLAVALTLVRTKMLRGLLTVALFLVDMATGDPDLSTKENWRCGVFIPGKKFKEPLAKFFVLQTLPPAACPPEGKPDTRSMRKTCGQMGRSWEESFLQFERLWTPFLAKVPGNKRPVDVCSVIQLELGIDDIPRENEKKYKDGMQLGFYYNFCGGPKWKDTGLRTKSKVCCQDGVSRNCIELLQEKKEKKEMEAMQSANAIESGANPTGSESSQTMSLQETKEEIEETKKETKDESGATKKSESESNKGSSQESSAFVSGGFKESSTEELLKLLEEGSLSEAGVVALRGVLDDLKKKAGEVAENIKQLEEVLSVQKDLEKADKETAVSMLNLAGCIKTVTITVA